MGLLSFVREAGEKLFGKEVQAAEKPGADPAQIKAANDAAAAAIEKHVASFNLPITALTVTFDSTTGTAKVFGVAKDAATRDKALLAAGNVTGVAAVDDKMSVEVAAAVDPAKYYTVVSGDTLSKIAKQHYGNANLYQKIFEANQPLLKHPDKIYPGQVLRIPAA